MNMFYIANAVETLNTSDQVVSLSNTQVEIIKDIKISIDRKLNLMWMVISLMMCC